MSVESRGRHRELPEPRTQLGRRRFLGYLIAAPTLVVAAELGRSEIFGWRPVWAANLPVLPSPPQMPEYYDLLDGLRDVARPTANLITVEVKRDGTVSFALPRSDNGQGIITSTQMIIAEEMDLDPDQVRVTLADARPELVFNQLTGGSSSTFTTYYPIRVAAALAAGRLLGAAAAEMDQEMSFLTSRQGLITDRNGRSMSFGELTEKAASPDHKAVEVLLKKRENFKVIGKSRTKSDARAMVTGKKKFTTDLKVPDALPTVICRAPDLNGFPKEASNLDEVRNMSGVTDVVKVSTGYAVRAKTFGQAIDAVNKLSVSWNKGTVHDEDDESVLAQVRKAELPLAVPKEAGQTVEGEFAFYFRSGSPLETNCAIADVRKDRAEIWSASKSPIAAQYEIAKGLGLPQNKVDFHVIEGGGSFGRKLFFDAAEEAAECSQKMGKPVKLMWTRADDSRQGRVHPLCTSRIRAVIAGGSVVSFEQRHTSVATEGNPGFSEALTATAQKYPGGNLAVSEILWELTQVIPYEFGNVTRVLNEVQMGFNTSSTRNIFSPDAATARELMVDQLARKMDEDPYEFRRRHLKQARWRKVLERAAEEGDWGKSMDDGTAQGIAFHTEYKGASACVVEIDNRSDTVNRKIRSARTGARVTKVTFVIDPGLVINPRGLEAQMMGGINDALAMTLTAGMHLTDGHFVEASWDNYFYTRQWNTPPEMNIIVIDDSDAPEPGGAGEAALAATCGAVACAFARATDRVPEFFPIYHKDDRPDGFQEYPTSPPIPKSPTDGLEKTF
jgi:isoquinoline 1-oxidoreductase subunit beta